MFLVSIKPFQQTGIAEEHILYVYVQFHNPNCGIIIVCTDHSTEVFFECKNHTQAIFEDLEERKIFDIIDKCTVTMYENFGKLRPSLPDMREIMMVIIANTTLNQFTTYNFPLLTRASDFHFKYG